LALFVECTVPMTFRQYTYGITYESQGLSGGGGAELLRDVIMD
jgi:hypothetical protein